MQLLWSDHSFMQDILNYTLERYCAFPSNPPFLELELTEPTGK